MIRIANYYILIVVGRAAGGDSLMIRGVCFALSAPHAG